jgi:hypothetical protein
MAINSNKKKKTLEVEYFDKTIRLNVKFHQTDNYGPTITLSEIDSKEYVSFPAKMFREIADLIDDEDLLSDGKKKDDSFFDGSGNEEEIIIPQIDEDSVVAPIKVAVKKTQQITTEEVAVDEVVEGNDFESFGGGEEASEVEPDIQIEPVEEVVSDPEAEKAFIEARQNAISKAGSAEKKVIKRLEE